jgi:NADH-quinone oxidoreductase subunit A
MSVTADWKERGTVNAYAPIFVLGGIAAGFAIFSVFMASIIGPKRYNRAKLEAYECGIEPTPQPVGGGRFPIKYYLTAMLFIVFDIEIVFLYPLAVQLRQLQLFGFMELLVFIGLLGIGYVYIWRKGALEWK